MLRRGVDGLALALSKPIRRMRGAENLRGGLSPCQGALDARRPGRLRRVRSRGKMRPSRGETGAASKGSRAESGGTRDSGGFSPLREGTSRGEASRRCGGVENVALACALRTQSLALRGALGCAGCGGRRRCFSATRGPHAIRSALFTWRQRRGFEGGKRGAERRHRGTPADCNRGRSTFRA